MRDANRLRPTRALAVRTPTSGAVSPDLNAVTTIHDFNYAWDAVSNLTEVTDARTPSEWPAGYRPWSQSIRHDALYRVNRIDYGYTGGTGPESLDDLATDWREEQDRHEAADPMRRRPAPMVSDNAATRVRWLEYDYDWLANQVEWRDDQGVYYERSPGHLRSGSDDPAFNGFSPALRPSALYLSTNIRSTTGATYEEDADRGGYTWLTYGDDGNVTQMTVRSQCVDVSASDVCSDTTSGTLTARHNRLKANCLCAQEQHYRYDWDELNRLQEARRYDRQGGAGDWTLMLQQRYRYDAGNVRLIKETINFGQDGDAFAATALSPYPGDYERRGLELDTVANTYHASTTLGTETQYLVGGARLVWGSNTSSSARVDREQRLTLPLSDLVQSTAAVVDLLSGDLVEHTTFYPNGARETHRTTEDTLLQLEPIGFTGKEADEEVGLVYFGERYLIPRLGRWASVDPLSVHAVGGGEALNGYHYVSGNLLQARDPLGLACDGACQAAAEFETQLNDDWRTITDTQEMADGPEGEQLYAPMEARREALQRSGQYLEQNEHGNWRVNRAALPSAHQVTMRQQGADVRIRQREIRHERARAEREYASRIGQFVAITTLLISLVPARGAIVPRRAPPPPRPAPELRPSSAAGGSARVGGAAEGVVPQLTTHSCGQTCGVMILGDRGLVVSRTQVANAAGTAGVTTPGQLATGMTEISGIRFQGGIVNADRAGYASMAEGLSSTGNPWVAMIGTGDDAHWIVVDSVRNGQVTVRDPARGVLTLGVDHFARIWNGSVVRLAP